MCWMADSRHWVYFTDKVSNEDNSVQGETSAILYDALEPKKKTVIPLPLAEQIGGPTFTPSDHMIELAEDWGKVETDTLQVTGVTEWRFLPTVQRLHHFEVHRPQPAGIDNIKVEEVALNHRGDRIAWMLSGKRRTPQLFRLLHRFWPSLNLPPTAVEMIWVTHLDGSHPHELGYLPLKAQNADGTVDNATAGWVDGLLWLPGDKQISFERRNEDPEVVYTIPAD